MNTPTYALKDAILRYLIERAGVVGHQTVSISHNAFEAQFNMSPIHTFTRHLLQEIQNDNLILINKHTYNQHQYTVTSLGFDFMANGGYAQQHAEKQKAKRHQNMEFKLIRWKVKWFWVSQIIALIALIISVFALAS